MEEAVERGRRLGRRYTLAVFVTFAASFVIWTAKDITFAVFGVGAGPLPEPGSRPTPCEEALRAMTAAVDRAVGAAAGARDDAQASAEFRAALGPEWDDESAAQARCSDSARSQDALAAVLRFRGAGEDLARRNAEDLAPLRKDLAVYLPSERVPK